MSANQKTTPRASRKSGAAEIAALKARIAELEGGAKPAPAGSKPNMDDMIEVENKTIRPVFYVGAHPGTGEPVEYVFGSAPISPGPGQPATQIPGSKPHRAKLPRWLVETPAFQQRVTKGHFEVRA